MNRKKTSLSTIVRRSLVLVCALVFMGSSTALAQVSPEDVRSINAGTQWWDENFNACSTEEVDAEEVAAAGNGEYIEQAYDFFTSKGLSTMHAAAIIGNLEQESGPGIRPTAVNGIGATGSAQWLGGRKDKLISMTADWARDMDPPIKGEPWKNFGLQLRYLWWEVSSDKSAEKQAFNALGKLKSAKTLPEAVEKWERAFERAGEHEKMYGKRIAYAEKVIDAVKSGKIGNGVIETSEDVGEGSTGTDLSSGECAEAIDGGNSQFVDGFTVYNQCDPSWGSKPYGTTGKTICSSGCGPTAMAMIITALTGKRVTPPQTIAYANSIGMYIPGVGSSWDVAPRLAKHWNLKSEAIGKNKAKIESTLRSGGMVITSGTGPKPFTSAGHYIVIRAVTAEGKWKVGDSAHSDTSAKDWDPSFIMGIMNGGATYAITK